MGPKRGDLESRGVVKNGLVPEVPDPAAR